MAKIEIFGRDYMTFRISWGLLTINTPKKINKAHNTLNAFRSFVPINMLATVAVNG